MSSSPVLRDLERGDPQWATALPVLRELRPHLTDELLDHVLRDGASQVLRFTALFEDDRCVAVAGWRVVVNTSAIRKLYIDDLATDAAGSGSTNIIRPRWHAVTDAHIVSRWESMTETVEAVASHAIHLSEQGGSYSPAVADDVDEDDGGEVPVSPPHHAHEHPE